MPGDIYDLIQELRAGRRPFAVATVVETVGSVSAKTSSKAVIDERGRVVAGWVGGGCAESATCHTALGCIQSGRSEILEVDMTDEVLGAGMPCGDHMRIYVEPVLPRPALWILGHGRVAECLCSIGDLRGLEVIVHDALADRERYAAASSLITDDPGYAGLRRPGQATSWSSPRSTRAITCPPSRHWHRRPGTSRWSPAASARAWYSTTCVATAARSNSSVG